ncbi:DUF6901 family protein [Telmatospirillum siberiense]|uniref:Uncharacterized protein n=1 Tax=Telmatospirillum siberiense TaxID=382514 RepID=A0A2N3PTQ1_9PROT|nr:hypothetical protein [Telmatospirillum siberiense]PKU23778.1 hypothetical protein CWS72_14900 [Telmatospirillum siberiense]
MEHYVIYRFFAADNEKIEVRLDFDAITFELLPVTGQPTPDWARLDHHPCRDCACPTDVIYCPTALALARFIGSFDTRFSYEKAVVEIETPQRVILSKGSFQSGMASLLAVVCATSGCPATRFLRPQVRFLIPFSDGREALFRTVSTYLLCLHMNAAEKEPVQRRYLDEVAARYVLLRQVTANLVVRLRPVLRRHAALNADILLDAFSEIAAVDFDEGLAELRMFCGD